MTNRPLVATDFDDGLACRVRYEDLFVHPAKEPIRTLVGPGCGTHLGSWGLYWPDEHDRTKS